MLSTAEYINFAVGQNFYYLQQQNRRRLDEKYQRRRLHRKELWLRTISHAQGSQRGPLRQQVPNENVLRAE